MKKILILAIDTYQQFFYVVFKNLFGINQSCRFDVTCSNYARQAIKKNGVLKGSKISFARILKCQPFYKG